MHEHVRFIYDFAVAIRARNIVEFGVGPGHSTLCLAAVAEENGGEVLSIDPRNKHKDFVKNNLCYWDLDKYCKLFYGKDSFTFRKSYHKKYKDAPIDLMLIDSGHTYKTTKKEIEIWLPLIREGGTVFFHDIVWCFDSVQLAVDEFLAPEKVAFIKTNGFMKEQCGRCNGILRPMISKNGRPTEQSAETFDVPDCAKKRTFFDYNLQEISHNEAKARGYDYSYDMRTNCSGLGVLVKHTSHKPIYDKEDAKFVSNWNKKPGFD